MYIHKLKNEPNPIQINRSLGCVSHRATTTAAGPDRLGRNSYKRSLYLPVERSDGPDVQDVTRHTCDESAVSERPDYRR